MSDLVSIYIPTRNRVELLGAAVRSVLAQTHGNIEVLVVDDGSTDSTPDYMAGVVACDDRVQYIRHETSLGACAARNAAISASHGDFITGLDDDDEFTPGHIAGLIAYWALLQELGIQPSGVFVQYCLRNDGVFSESSKQGCVQARDLLDANHVGNQLFAPRRHYIEAGLFDTRMPAWQDLEFFYRILSRFGPARLLDSPSYVFDVSPRPDRISSQQRGKILEACRLMFEKHGAGDARTHQKLMLQAYSDYYGLPVGVADVLRFCRNGLWLRGYVSMLRRLLGRSSGF